MNATRATLLVAVLCFASTTNAITIGGIRLTDLGEGVVPNAINNNTNYQIVGQNASGEAFVWQSGTMILLGTLGGMQSAAKDVNDNGVVVGWALDAGEQRKAFRWSGTMTNLDLGSTGESGAESVNNAGSVVGWRYTSEDCRSLIWYYGSNAAIEILSHGSKALEINNAGHVVASSTRDPDSDGRATYYWNGAYATRNTYTLARFGYSVRAMNSNDLSVGYTPAMQIIGDGTTVPLASYYGWSSPFAYGGIGLLSAQDPFSSALGVNDNGLIVGTSGDKAFLYDVNNHTIFDLDNLPQTGDSFAQLISVYDINNNNQFVGVGLIGGVEHGFVGQIVPEPGTLVLMLGAATSLLAFALRRRRMV